MPFWNVLRHHSPSTIAKPASRYSHAVEVPARARLLFISGQLGVKPDGTPAQGFEAQAEQAWHNLGAALAAAGMGYGNLVRITTYVTDPANVPLVRTVRDRFIKDPPPASTLLVVQALASPHWLFELEGVAASTGWP